MPTDISRLEGKILLILACLILLVAGFGLGIGFGVNFVLINQFSRDMQTDHQYAEELAEARLSELRGEIDRKCGPGRGAE